MWCWGDSDGIPGAVKGKASHDFVGVPGVVDARVLMASNEGHCVFDAYRRGLCWSDDGFHELSTGSGQEVKLPLRSAVEMTALPGNLVTLFPSVAVVGHGSVLTWGDIITTGRPVPDPIVDVRTPLPVLGLIDAVRIDAGKRSYYASLRDGRVFCWGQEIIPDTLTQMPFLAFKHGPYKKITPNPDLCALTAAGHVERFDRGVKDTEFDGVADVAAGAVVLCLVMRDGRVLCGGHNTEAELGNGTLGGGSGSAMIEVHFPPLH